MTRVERMRLRAYERKRATPPESCEACHSKMNRWPNAQFCWGCQYFKQMVQASIPLVVKLGIVPPAKSRNCMDCDAPAVAYDHRDYGRILWLEPVCRSCNRVRGGGDVPESVKAISRSVKNYNRICRKKLRGRYNAIFQQLKIEAGLK